MNTFQKVNYLIFDKASNCDGINNDIYQHWLQYFSSTLQL